MESSPGAALEDCDSSVNSVSIIRRLVDDFVLPMTPVLQISVISCAI